MKKVTATPESFDVEKNAIGVKQHDTKEAPKVLVSRATVLDTIILEGGSWEELTAKADAAAAPLKTKIKHYTKSLFLTHIRYRTTKRPNYFKSVVIKEEGIVVK
jgi:hypothetical protein